MNALFLMLAAIPAQALFPLSVMEEPGPQSRTVVIRLQRGDAVEIDWCNSEHCAVKVGELRGYVRRDAFGSARDVAIVRAQREGEVLRATDQGRMTSEYAVQRIERLKVSGVEHEPPPLRVGIVGVTVVKSDVSRLIRDGETVTAACSDGVRKLTARVRTKPAGRGLTAVSVSVDCDALWVVTLKEREFDVERLSHQINGMDCADLADVDGDGRSESVCWSEGLVQVFGSPHYRVIAELEFAESALSW